MHPDVTRTLTECWKMELPLRLTHPAGVCGVLYSICLSFLSDADTSRLLVVHGSVNPV